MHKKTLFWFMVSVHSSWFQYIVLGSRTQIRQSISAVRVCGEGSSLLTKQETEWWQRPSNSLFPDRSHFPKYLQFPQMMPPSRTKCLTHIPIGGSLSWNHEPRLSGNKEELCDRGRFQFNQGKTGRQNKDCLTLELFFKTIPGTLKD